MKKINFKKLNFKKLFLGSVATVLPLTTAISCASKDDVSNSWIKNKRELVTFLTLPEGNESIKWFNTEGAYSRTSNIIGLKDAQPRLFSHWYYNGLDGEVKVQKQYIKFMLAKSLSITYTENDGSNAITHIFNDDKLKTKDSANNINGSKFKELIKNLYITKIEFQIRDDAKWVNHKGEKTQYEVINKDFLRGFRFQIYKFISKLRYYAAGWNNSVSSDDIPEFKTNQKLSSFENKFTNKVIKDFFATTTADNRYIFLMGGIDPKDFYGVDFEGKLVNDDKIAPDADPKKIVLNFELEDDKSADVVIDYMLNDHSAPFSAVPSKYIDTMKKDSFSQPKTNPLGKIGFYTYAREYDKNLYASSYYISNNTKTIFEVKKNMHYSDHVIRDEKKSILKHTTFITKGIDEKTAPIQNYNRFKEGVDYIINSNNFNNLSNSKKIDIYKNNKKSIIKYTILQKRRAPNQIEWALLPNLTPNSKGIWKMDNAAFNENFGKILWGKSRSDLKQINTAKSQEVFEHILTKAAVFKSLLRGSINWQQYISQVFGGNAVYWPYNIAEGSSILGKKTPLDTFIKNKYVNTPLIKWDPALNKIVNLDDIEGFENFKRSSTIKDPKEVWKSYKYETIKSEMKILLDSIFGTNSSDEVIIKFPMAIRSTLKDFEKPAYSSIANTIESLSSGRYKFQVVEEPNKTRNEYNPDWPKWIIPTITGKGTHDWFGWGADFDDALGLWAGKLLISQYRHRSWIQILSFLSKQDSGNIITSFPNAKIVADYFKTKYNEKMSSANFINKIKKVIDEQKLANKDIYSWNSIKDKLKISFEDITTQQTLLKTSANPSNTLSQMLLGSTYNSEESTINLIIDEVFNKNLQKWVLTIQTDAFNSNESKIEGFLKEISIINGLSMQIGRNAHKISGLTTHNTAIVKEWLIKTQDRDGYSLLAEWKIK